MLATERGRMWLARWQRTTPSIRDEPRSSGRSIFSLLSMFWGGNDNTNIVTVCFQYIWALFESFQNKTQLELIPIWDTMGDTPKYSTAYWQESGDMFCIVINGLRLDILRYYMQRDILLFFKIKLFYMLCCINAQLHWICIELNSI